MATRNARKGAIDPRTGAIRFDEWDTVLHPTTTLKAFLATSLGRACTPVLANDYIDYVGLGWCRLGGREFDVMVAFKPKGGTIDWMSLSLNEDYDGETVYEAQMALNAAHWRWLKRQLPDARALPNGEWQFAWGTVAARYIAKNDECAIIIDYDKPKKKPPRRAARRRTRSKA